MSNRDEIDRLLRDAYSARQRGDVDGLLRLFSDDVRFQLAGTPQTGMVPAAVSGRDDFRSLLTGLVRTFELLDHEILSTLTPAPELFVQATRMQTPAILCQPDSLTARQITKLVEFVTERESLPR